MVQAVATTASHEIAPAQRCAHMAFVPYRTCRLSREMCPAFSEQLWLSAQGRLTF